MSSKIIRDLLYNYLSIDTKRDGWLHEWQVELLTRQLDLERKLASLVEDAYGSTPEERPCLRSTRPIHDPLDVLEAKIQGHVDPIAVIDHEGA